MKLKSIKIENFRGIRDEMFLPLHSRLTILVGDNANGKTTILEALATGLGIIPSYFSVKGKGASHDDIHQYQPTLSNHFALSNSLMNQSEQAPYMRITLETLEGILWDVSKYNALRKKDSEIPKAIGYKKLHDFLNTIHTQTQHELPIVAYYGTNRALLSSETQSRAPKKNKGRFSALNNSLSGIARFNDLKNWFAEEEDIERRNRLEYDDAYRSPILQTVREAQERLLPGCSHLRTIPKPTRLLVDFKYQQEPTETLLLEQLSEGYRTTWALVADLARRMAIANPHLKEKILETQAIVLIDEVDLHLHPNWQQQIVAIDEPGIEMSDERPIASLLQVFPNTQFIVTTHSDELVTSVKPENVVHLFRSEGTIRAEPVSAYTYGAKSGRVLERVMEGSERPRHNTFTQLLNRYYELIEEDEWDSEMAQKIKKRLDELSPDEPELVSAQMEIRRRQVISGG
ncbi:MAG: hypothetical protein DRR00_08595 [Candidatus Parabeggiatoa sp. nov. 3]|nr:MAG: hypothetical protein DRR00_08595 [Gammaproteobacteria bacterium]RKZ66880.1 MAG: hypothetical protein DRQ99_08300 [Gammaproteobacteria bacterium]